MTVLPMHQPKWQPDDFLIDAAIAGRVRGNELPASDRAWLVAQLTHRGHANDIIADWLSCSRRTVQMARIDPVAVLTTRLLVLEQAVEKAESKARASRVEPEALREVIADRDRFRDRANRLIDQLADMRRLADQPCPPSVMVIHPPRTRRRPALTAETLPLF